MKLKRFALAVFCAGVFSLFTPPMLLHAQGNDDAKIQQDVQKSLGGSRFKDVQIAVQNGVVKLTGTVPVFQDKEDADKKAHRVKKTVAVENEIEVAPGEMSDAQLQAKLQKQLAWDRVGYGNAFNAITLTVQNGVVSLGGHALGPNAASSAVSLVSNTKGVLDVIDNIQIDPVSPMDDRTRQQVARAVYGFPSLTKYAIDPAAPIRITVVSGHVILSGVVLSQADKNAAGIRANSVSGVFSVTNNLQVANSSER
jgi:hyperosmotically inducible periplasmic protein